MENLGRLNPNDEVKFVLSDRTDYEFARDFVALTSRATGKRGAIFACFQ